MIRSPNMGISIDQIRDPRQRARYEEALRSGVGTRTGENPAVAASGSAARDRARPPRLISQSHKPLNPEDRLNKTEKAFLARLRSDELGHFEWIGIQCITLELAFNCRYTPDFATRMQGGDFRLWEVKGGHIWEDGWVKLKMAARLYPFWTFVKAQRKGRSSPWVETIIQA